MGAWPPVSPDRALIEPLEALAACTPHSAASDRPDSPALVRDTGTDGQGAVAPQ
jgi:hypothetical protein